MLFPVSREIVARFFHDAISLTLTDHRRHAIGCKLEICERRVDWTSDHCHCQWRTTLKHAKKCGWWCPQCGGSTAQLEARTLCTVHFVSQTSHRQDLWQFFVGRVKLELKERSLVDTWHNLSVSTVRDIRLRGRDSQKRRRSTWSRCVGWKLDQYA